MHYTHLSGLPLKTSSQRSTWSVSFMISPETSHDFTATEPKPNTSLLQLIVVNQTHAGVHSVPLHMHFDRLVQKLQKWQINYE